MSGTASSASAGSDDEIRLRVETISGEVIQLVVSKHETVLKLKNRIFKKQGIPVAEQNLMFLEEELKDFHTLDEYNIIDSCTIKLSIGMKGGPINHRRTLYLDDKNTIQEMAKMLAAHDISVVLVPHNGAFHVIPVASDKRDGAQCSSAERRHSSRHSVAKLMEGGHQQQSQHQQPQPHSSQQQQATAGGSGGRRVEENKATKSKMVALQKQFKKKRSALGQIPAMISRQGGCCASNLQKSILSDAMPPLAAAPVALVAAGGSGAEAAEHQHKVVVPRLITSHPHISLNELNPSQTLTQFYTATTATADGGGAFESSSSYASGVERNVVFYPTAGTSGRADPRPPVGKPFLSVHTKACSGAPQTRRRTPLRKMFRLEVVDALRQQRRLPLRTTRPRWWSGLSLSTRAKPAPPMRRVLPVRPRLQAS